MILLCPCSRLSLQARFLLLTHYLRRLFKNTFKVLFYYFILLFLMQGLSSTDNSLQKTRLSIANLAEQK